jgi:alkylated DNA nucleotide flippase Atl1
MKTRKSWKEKLHTDQQAKVVAIPPRLQKRFGRGQMLIPRPLDVDAVIRHVPRGKLVAPNQIREKLAREAGADVTCPMVVGIFVRIVAEAAEESAREGKSRITPYWRVVRDDGKLFEKLPGGPVAQAERLVAEGHQIDDSGKLRVKNPGHALVRFR